MTAFYADTYAIMALLNGDPTHIRRFRAREFRTSWLNLYEAYYSQLARGVPEAEAAARLAPLEAHAEHPDWLTLKLASRFRLELKKTGRSCSYVDAAGYLQARQAQVPFLTGDPVFKGLEGVEFLEERASKRRR